ncbi:VOC family protein [Paeniglutamicibacter gangotriensis]|uniref:Glyoxalase family protein n=1 Tax=Paeniglutamicibacter gangotriensis Lz1y TaxID=1276920 RepID=M7MTF3_9MICC|nr:VOC family protein [Paeniglutamicibacter gangotriensis]EMQ98215.1 glyoxalase family protein [Paeniglutamicibacter gangotriensis Lz1y]
MSTTTQDQLSADLAMGTVMLKVGDLGKMSDYYQRALGLEVLSEGPTGTGLGRRGLELVHLSDGTGLSLPGRGEAGLFHTALLFDTQSDLAATVLSAAQYDGALFTGSSDHLVSEAFYFNDPEGNGIELYFDRPRDTWTWNGDTVAMDTIHLDPNDYLNTHVNEAAVAGLAQANAAIGHVHLQVGDVDTAEKFYVDTLGFAKTTGFHGQALFVSAGGYHHHMAMNVWNSRGAGPRKDTLGLGEVVITVPHADEVGALADRLKVAGVANHHTGAELRFDDPWANKIRVSVG